MHVVREIAGVTGKSNIVRIKSTVLSEVVETLDDDFVVCKIFKGVDECTARWLVDEKHAVRAHDER